MGVLAWNAALYRTYLNALDLLFPPRCAGCGRLGSHWCAECQAGVTIIRGATCPRCGLPETSAKLCADCRGHPSAFDQARAWARYDAGLRPVVVALKYRSNQGLSWVLAEKMAGHLEALPWQPDVILPVPLAEPRLRERGHNQAALLAQPLSTMIGLPFLSRALVRQRDTPKQVGLSLHARRENMRDAFWAEVDQVRGRCCLVVDDVMTTGATLDAAAAALKRAGAAQVFALTLGRATL